MANKKVRHPPPPSLFAIPHACLPPPTKKVGSYNKFAPTKQTPRSSNGHRYPDALGDKGFWGRVAPWWGIGSQRGGFPIKSLWGNP
jgi:hypothetical protein